MCVHKERVNNMNEKNLEEIEQVMELLPEVDLLNDYFKELSETKNIRRLNYFINFLKEKNMTIRDFYGFVTDMADAIR